MPSDRSQLRQYEGRIEGRTNPKVLIPALLAFILLGGGALLLANSDEEKSAKPATTTTSTEPVTTSTTEKPKPTAVPDEVVALTEARLVVLDSSSGEVKRVLYSAKPGEFHFNSSISLSHDKKFVYFDIRESTADPEGTACRPQSIWRAPLAGGSPEKVRANSILPSLSPDGSQIAFAVDSREHGFRPQHFCTHALRVENLQTGKGRSYLPDKDHDGWQIESLEWDPDSRNLLMKRCIEECAVSVFDTKTAKNLETSREIVDPGPSCYDGGTWKATQLAVASSHCYAESEETHPNVKHRIVLVDSGSGRQQGEVTTANERVIDIDYDNSGQHLMFTTYANPEQIALFVMPRGSSPKRLALEVLTAEW